jgi:transposase
MNRRTLAIDLAKDVFEIAIANEHWRIVAHHRLSRSRFTAFMAQQPACDVVMEACGSAHHWGRVFTKMGHRCRLLPVQYVRPYRMRNKTDRADAEALLEAARSPRIEAVAVKSVNQQQIQLLHRLREQYKADRLARINVLRGSLRELGIPLPVGATVCLKRAPEAIEQEGVPHALRMALTALLTDIAQLKLRMEQIELQLLALSKSDPAIQRLRQVPGIGLLTSTALVAAAGCASSFKSARHFSSWLGITPRESSSGNRRFLGRISKQGNTYLRTLIIHGARAVLARAKQLRRQSEQPLNRIHQWAVELERRVGHNKAAVALANKLARIAWAVWRHERDFEAAHLPEAVPA